MTRLSNPFEIKNASVQENGLFSGYASTYGGPGDAFGDVIAPNAFAASLAKHAEAGSTPAMLWAHDPSEVLGRWLSFKETPKGLQVRGQLALDISKAKEAYSLVKIGALALSIGFRVSKNGSQWDAKNKVRVLTEIDLLETSLVAIPANPAAKITEIKSIRDLESLLRDGQEFSNRQAKKLAAGGFRALVGRDDPDDETEIRTMVNEIELLTKTLISMR